MVHTAAYAIDHGINYFDTAIDMSKDYLAKVRELVKEEKNDTKNLARYATWVSLL